MIYDDLTISIGKTIKDARIQKGMTLEALGKAIGVTKATVQKYESGRIARIGEDKLKLIAKVLGISLERLSPDHYGGLTPWAERLNKIEASNALLSELYGDSMVALVAMASMLTDEGHGKLIDRAGELLEVPRYNQVAAEIKADAARDQELEGE